MYLPYFFSVNVNIFNNTVNYLPIYKYILFFSLCNFTVYGTTVFGTSAYYRYLFIKSNNQIVTAS